MPMAVDEETAVAQKCQQRWIPLFFRA